ncbi:MAG: EutN/CcmL family microcompartment protein [candidate division Zixibacteria bacterium]|nr:EutN/CcmL family microcompartment protein [candidate division Zixibacteria bacterium]
MTVGRVVGNVVSTVKHPLYNGQKILLVQPVDPVHGKPGGNTVVAVDTVGVGIGELVLVATEGRAASEILKVPRGPVRSIIVGIVDEIETET